MFLNLHLLFRLWKNYGLINKKNNENGTSFFRREEIIWKSYGVENNVSANITIYNLCKPFKIAVRIRFNDRLIRYFRFPRASRWIRIWSDASHVIIYPFHSSRYALIKHLARAGRKLVGKSLRAMRRAKFRLKSTDISQRDGETLSRGTFFALVSLWLRSRIYFRRRRGNVTSAEKRRLSWEVHFFKRSPDHVQRRRCAARGRFMPRRRTSSGEIFMRIGAKVQHLTTDEGGRAKE